MLIRNSECKRLRILINIPHKCPFRSASWHKNCTYLNNLARRNENENLSLCHLKIPATVFVIFQIQNTIANVICTPGCPN
jgi:hypothetical protein